MIKETITYLGYDGKEKTGDFYFNLTRGEIAELHLSLPGGLDGFLEHMNDSPEAEDIIEVFKKIILKSYGKRTATNGFIKSKEISEAFAATDAYSELFLKFIENEDDFVNKFLDGAIAIKGGSVRKILEESKNNNDLTAMPLQAEDVDNSDSLPSDL